MARTKVDPLLTTAEVAAAMQCTPGNVRGLRSRGYFPEPDDLDEDAPVNRRTPRWRLSTIDRYLATRPGAGWRTDLEERK